MAQRLRERKDNEAARDFITIVGVSEMGSLADI